MMRPLLHLGSNVGEGDKSKGPKEEIKYNTVQIIRC